jgi:Bacterial protein of unknown function (DUF937)
MAIDLVGSVSQFLTPQLIRNLARAVGVNEAVAQKLVSAAIPVVLGVLATTAAAPGGAQKLVDAVSNSDPDLSANLAAAINTGNVRALNDGANLLGGLLGGSGLSNIVGALSQYSGATHPAAQAAAGAVTQSAIGAIGQQDPSNWSDRQSIAAMFGAQKDAIAAAIPGEISRALGATGLLAGLGGLRSDPVRTTSAATSRPAAPASAPSGPPPSQTASAATSRPATPASPTPSRAPVPPPASSGFPTWAIILLIVIVLAAIWWWFASSRRPAEPAKTGMLQAPIEMALTALPRARA